MFIVLLHFSRNKSRAGQFMDGHKQWIQRGFDDGVFLLAGSLQPGRGGGLLAHNITPTELERRVQEDPFVAENIVRAEIIEMTATRAEARLDFLRDKTPTP